MATVYKIIARDKKTGRQYKKWTYVNKDKFDRHSPEIIKRYTRSQWDGKEFDIEFYKMINDVWERSDARFIG